MRPRAEQESKKRSGKLKLLNRIPLQKYVTVEILQAVAAK